MSASSSPSMRTDGERERSDSAFATSVVGQIPLRLDLVGLAVSKDGAHL
jgi:hypothetical protein